MHMQNVFKFKEDKKISQFFKSSNDYVIHFLGFTSVV